MGPLDHNPFDDDALFHGDTSVGDNLDDDSNPRSEGNQTTDQNEVETGNNSVQLEDRNQDNGNGVGRKSTRE
jgi:hypothetical protein